MSHYNCFHPRHITTPYGEDILVRCGKCEACTNIRSMNLQTMCELESQAHRYCMFVTLTYDNHHLPLVRPFRHSWYHHDEDGVVTGVDNSSWLEFIPMSSRLVSHMSRLNRHFFAISYDDKQSFETSLSLYESKFHLPEHLKGLIPVLDKVDFQLFMKRLRYYLSKYTNEKVRFFACGEYGPVHFRPHYHVLLWCDQPETSRVLSSVVRSSWKYGRIDCQWSKGSVASYVSSYVNSISTRSRLHAVKYLRPFFVHSSFLFGKFYENEIQALSEVSYMEVARKTYNSSCRSKQVPPLLAFESQLYGRCLNFRSLGHFDRLACYQYARVVRDEFGNLPVSELARLVFSHPDSRSSRLLSYLSFNGNFKESTVISVIYRSDRFIRYCKHYNFSEEYMLRLIERYWQDRDLYLLHEQLREQESYSRELGLSWLPYLLGYYAIEPPRDFNATHEWPKPVLDYMDSIGLDPLFYTESTFPLKGDFVYSSWYACQKRVSCDKVKHKKLNDQNKIFL